MPPNSGGSPTNFNPRSPDGERPYEDCGIAAGCRISIHAPRMGSDRKLHRQSTPINISIHAPRMGSDHPSHAIRPFRDNFNPRSPDGERPAHKYQRTVARYFNPRSPDGERHIAISRQLWWTQFQSTLPGWGATSTSRSTSPTTKSNFNPRSPDGERRSRAVGTTSSAYFNPRSPDGERPAAMTFRNSSRVFQSTLPGWGATIRVMPRCESC